MPTIKISILNVSIETKPTKTGKSYQQAEVAFKNLTFQGKVESKKLMSFGAQADAFKTLSNAQAGQEFTITVVKNDAGYNDWTEAKSGLVDGPAESSPASYAKQASSAAAPAAKSNYETADERAARQVLIVRQSNVSSAVNLLVAGAKTPPKVADVLAVARELEDYVFGRNAAPMETASGFDDMDNDIVE